MKRHFVIREIATGKALDSFEADGIYEGHGLIMVVEENAKLSDGQAHVLERVLCLAPGTRLTEEKQ